MNREWMYGDRRILEYITGVNNFLEVVVANKENGFMCCPCTMCGIGSLTLNDKPFTSTFFIRVSCHTIMFGPSMEK